MVRPRALAVALALTGCHGGSHAPAPHARGSAATAVKAAPPQPEVDIAAAVPAWQAVVDRDHYLARRDAHGVVEGTAVGLRTSDFGLPRKTDSGSDSDSDSDSDSGSASGSASVEVRSPKSEVPPYTWLLDDTDSTGSLAIRVRLPATTAVDPGDHLAITGAWQVDADHHWFWAATAVTRLPPLAPTGSASVEVRSPKSEVPPSHTIARGEPPEGAVPISQAHDGDAALFQLVGPPPALPGDGWPVGDRAGGAVVLLLDLPGERASYGAQDLRSPDERWHLARGATYWVRLGRVHHHGPTRPATVIARTAPVRVR